MNIRQIYCIKLSSIIRNLIKNYLGVSTYNFSRKIARAFLHPVVIDLQIPSDVLVTPSHRILSVLKYDYRYVSGRNPTHLLLSDDLIKFQLSIRKPFQNTC